MNICGHIKQDVSSVVIKGSSELINTEQMDVKGRDKGNPVTV